MLITRLLTTNNRRRRRQRVVGSDRSVALQCCQVLSHKIAKKMFQKQAQSRGKNARLATLSLSSDLDQ